MADFLKYDVGTNFDLRIFDIIKEADTKKRITNIYGKLKNDGLPGGRATSTIADLTEQQFADYLKLCRDNGLTFNYLINPLCMGQSELDPDEGANIRNTIHKLYDMGVREFTINSPSLIKYVKKTFNDVRVTLGLYAYPVSIQQVEYWRNWGVDEITLDHGFNRKFDKLRNLMTFYKDSDFAMRVIANNFCLRECPYRLTHGSFVGHSDPKAMSMDYSLINCEYRKIANPKAMLTAEWIRPEDVHCYEELAEETGYRNFSLKLVERNAPTAFIERVIRAYCAESYKGNLLDILNWPANKKGLGAAPAGAPPVMGMPAGVPPMGMPAGAPPVGMPAGGPPAGMPAGAPPVGMPAGGPPVGMPAGGPPMGMPAGGPPQGMPAIRFASRIDRSFMPRYGMAMNVPNIYIDNSKLDGFIEHFIKNNNCENTVCAGTMIEDGRKCSYACDHCGTWAKKAISFNEAEVAQWLENARYVLDSLESGSMYV